MLKEIKKPKNPENIDNYKMLLPTILSIEECYPISFDFDSDDFIKFLENFDYKKKR